MPAHNNAAVFPRCPVAKDVPRRLAKHPTGCRRCVNTAIVQEILILAVALSRKRQSRLNMDYGVRRRAVTLLGHSVCSARHVSPTFNEKPREKDPRFDH